MLERLELEMERWAALLRTAKIFPLPIIEKSRSDWIHGLNFKHGIFDWTKK